jgi:heat shock protein HslJ
MTTKNVLLIIIALAALGGGWYFMNKKPVVTPPAVVDTTVETIEVTYVSMTGESVVVEYTGATSALLRSDTLGVVIFSAAVSASGARYVSADGSYVLWNKGDEVTISRGETVVFEGTKPAEVGEPSALNTTWKWVKNEGKSTLTPKQKDAFTLTFAADNTVSGTTDCNSFSGAYDFISDGSFAFGPQAATKKFCDGSQETDFMESIRRVTSYAVSKDALVFVIGDGESRMVFEPK